MNKERLMRVILGPCLSEKATHVANEHNQIVFRVLKDATKREIKQAVEFLFKVIVNAVQVCNVRGKKKTFKQIPGCRNHWKKAYVSLAEGHDIKFAE